MRYRLPREADFDACLELVHNSLSHRPALRSRMPEIWRQLKRQGALISAVVDDFRQPDHETLQAIYMAVIVDDDYLEARLSKPRPWLIADLYERILAGESPVLDAEEVRRRNSASGVSCLMLHTGMRGTSDASFNRRLAEVMRDVCVLLHAGYRNRVVVEEVVGVRAREAMERSGFSLISDFAGAFAPGELPGENDHPYLFAVRPEHQLPGIVSGCSFYFSDVSPSFQFAPVQQQVLLHALFNESDDEIAESLGISVETVRKHWRSIYRHVQDVEPEFFPGGRSDGDSRGPEKRRYLLSHLRLHLDEVRPRLRPRARRDDR
jgi:FixJ family two-component response regulator